MPRFGRCLPSSYLILSDSLSTFYSVKPCLNLFPRNAAELSHGPTLDHLREQRGASHRGDAALHLEGRVCDSALSHHRPELQKVAANGISGFHDDSRLRDLTCVARMT